MEVMWSKHLGLDAHPASLALLAQVMRGRSVAGDEPDEWGVWATWSALQADLVPEEWAACELARVVVAMETCGGVPSRVAPVARQAVLWALGGER